LQDVDIEFALEDLPNLLKSMKLGAERIMEVSVSLRNFSRSDSILKIRANIHDGLDSSLVILRHRLKAAGTRPAITVIKEYGNLPEIECYPGLLNQVFINLIANAIDALEESLPAAPQIRIQTTVVDAHVVIEIADNGVGMPAEVQEKVFSQFFTTKAVGKGTGLGLSIARQIVEEKHNGRLNFISSVSQGTKFAIALPIN
jgi:signal transduction histidine kinase